MANSRALPMPAVLARLSRFVGAATSREASAGTALRGKIAAMTSFAERLIGAARLFMAAQFAARR
jgi:hypothetical protein